MLDSCPEALVRFESLFLLERELGFDLGSSPVHRVAAAA